MARESPRQGQRKGDFLGGKYLLEDCLGIGGMGEVYRATNVSLGRKVAIKILSAEYVKNEDDVLRFLREARAVAAVRHPNVVDVLDVARDDDGTPFIVQELLVGEDLEHYLSARGGRLSAAEALEIMIAVAEAVAAAHARDVVHRDLKPANIFLSKEGTKITPKVLDFGAALFPTLGALSNKELRMLIGTPHYMAPEQIVSKTDVDQRADVWALGIIMYEIMVGETPFEAESANAVLQLVKTREVPRLRSVLKNATEDMEELIVACTQRDKQKRLANAAAVVDKMNAVRDRMRGSTRMKVDTMPEVDEATAPPPRPKAPLPRPASDIKQTARIAESRIPSLLFPDQKPTAPPPPNAPDLPPELSPVAKPRGLLTLSQPGDQESEPPSSRRREPPASEQRPIEMSRGGLADLALDDPMPSSIPPKPSAPSLSPRHEKDLDLDPDDAKLDLRLAAQPKWRPPSFDEAPPKSRRGETSEPLPESRDAKMASSIPPVLDPRAAVSPARATSSVRPPMLHDDPPVSSVRAEPSTPNLTPAIHRPRTPAQPLVTGEWTTKAKALFGARVAVPALVVYAAFMAIRPISAPLGRAMRGDSTLSSGILAVSVLVIALVLCAKSVVGTKERAVFVAAAGAILFGIVMIIVTSGAGEAAELGLQAPGAQLVPFLGPIAPAAGAFACTRRAYGMWLATYEKREATIYATAASLLVFLTLIASPIGAVLRR